MKGTIHLKKAVMGLNGPVTDVAYDTELITVDDYLEAQDRFGYAAEVSPSAHLNLGIAAISRGTPDVPKEALKASLRGYDIVKVADIGLGFTRGLEDQEEDSSDETSTDTPNDTTKRRAS